MQIAYLRVIFHVKCKKVPFLEVLTWFLIHGHVKSKVAAEMVTSQASSSAITHKIYLLLLKGHSQLWGRADLDTTFSSLQSVYINPKSNPRVGYI